jgi:predicted methyltransferase
MKTILFKLKLFILFISISMGLSAQDIQTQVKQAMNASIRSDADKLADSYRFPAETLAFLGLKNNMRVMELMPGRGGYYAKILGQILADNGKLYEGLDGQAIAESLPEWGLAKIELLDDEYEMTRGEKRGYNIIGENLSFPVRDLDMVLTFRNLHDFAPESRKLLSTQVFKTLKSGGVFGVVGHTRRHMQPYNEEIWRRLDPIQVIKEIQAVGFKFVDYSDLHYRANDPLQTDTTTDELGRNSDRFTLIFAKP